MVLQVQYGDLDTAYPRLEFCYLLLREVFPSLQEEVLVIVWQTCSTNLNLVPYVQN